MDYDIDDLKQQHATMITKLNSQQKIIYDSVINSILNHKPNVFFYTVMEEQEKHSFGMLLYKEFDLKALLCL